MPYDTWDCPKDFIAFIKSISTIHWHAKQYFKTSLSHQEPIFDTPSHAPVSHGLLVRFPPGAARARWDQSFGKPGRGRKLRHPVEGLIQFLLPIYPSPGPGNLNVKRPSHACKLEMFDCETPFCETRSQT